MLINLIKRFFFIQNAASWVLSRIPPMFEHNVEKYAALRKALYLTGLEQLPGDYLEFGVFTGSSFVAAARIHQRLGFLGKLETKFFGFDSFEGFGAVTEGDKHPFYLDNIFRVDADRVIGNIRRKARGVPVEIVKGFFDKSLAEKTAAERGITKARIVFIDCDLFEPSRVVLNWVLPTLQPGTILIMDDFFSYRGQADKGVAGAFNAFYTQHPEIEFRRLFDYGMGGVGYIVSRIAPSGAGQKDVPKLVDARARAGNR